LERQRRLNALVGVDLARLPIDRSVRRIKATSVVVGLLGVAPFVWEWWTGTPLGL
jgi:hypothetical protein